MFIDPQRWIGCRACVGACRECSTHKGYSMIFVDYIDRSETTATMPTVCMHCTEPTCALVCPADAIKVNEDGVVMSALKERCLDCRNCVNACPFGVPKYNTAMHLQMKCARNKTAPPKMKKILENYRISRLNSKKCKMNCCVWRQYGNRT